jgi:HlyD family secretion protein
MKRLLLALCILLIGALVIWYFVLHHKKQDDCTITLYGNVDIRQVDISFRVEGRVKELFFDEGDTVHQGDLMATLDPQPYLDALNQSKGQLQAAQSTYEINQNLYQRRQQLISDGSVSQEDFDQSEANFKTAQGNLHLALAQVETAQTNVNDTYVYAPTDGWILTRIREPGSVVRVSDPVLTVSVKNPLWIRAYVTEPQLGLIYPGMNASVFTDTAEGKVYQGHIGFISPMAEFTPKTVETTQLRTDLVYRLRIIVDDADQGLRQGMPVTVKLQR